MKIHQGIRNVILAAILGAYGTSVSAQTAIQEVENFGGVAAAPQLTLGGAGSVITINGYIGRAACPRTLPNPLPAEFRDCLDADFFAFHAQKDTVLTFDIENGMGGSRNVDTFLSVFGPSPFRLLRENDDKPRPAGTPFNTDSRIANFTVPATGTYTVGVSAFSGLADGGTFRRTSVGATSVGDYTLIIKVESLPVQIISIDIKPGSGERAPINPKSKGNVPVALLGSTSFNPFDVYPESLTFGANGDEKSYLRCGRDGVDVNGDGHLDRVCHFENQTAGFSRGDLEGILRGKTKDGGLIEGHGMLKVVPEKKDD
jgi:hypothetical protein